MSSTELPNVANHLRRGTLACGALVIVVVLALLASQILRLARVDRLARSNPRAALAFAPLDAQALIHAAEADLRARPPLLATAAVRLALAAQANPLGAEIYSDLAQVAVMRGDAQRANALFALAAQRSRRLAAPQFWAFGRAAATQDYNLAWSALDIVSRSQPSSVSARLAPAAAVIAATPAGLASLSRRLASDPPWRTSFLLELGRRPATAGALALILSSLRDSAHPATDEETRGLLNGLVATGAYQRAYALWILLLPPKRLAAIGGLYNGRFEADAGEVPFNWTVPQDATGVAVLGADPTARQMRVDPMDRSATAPVVSQLLALAPGNYDLRGSVQNPDAEQPLDDGLGWTMRCADTGQVLATSDPIAVTSAWKRFFMLFTVPAQTCQGQWLDLRSRPSSTSTAQSGPVWFDNFSISPVRGPA